jgi:acetyl-CoA carboxylase carboxyltransferase component
LAKIKLGGGEKALQKQRDQGKMTARERLNIFLIRILTL